MVAMGRLLAAYRCYKGSLVQRELSAKLTEGLFYRSINACTNAAEIPADFVVGNTKNGKAIIFQKSGAVCIFFHIPLLIMLRAIQLNYQLGFCTVKVRYIFPQHFLSAKTDRMGT